MFDLNILGRKSGIDEHGGGFLYRNCESITVHMYNDLIRASPEAAYSCTYNIHYTTILQSL